MKEDFNRVVVFDFSKMTEADVEKAKAMLSNIMPGFNEVFEKGFKKKEIILDDVLRKLEEYYDEEGIDIDQPLLEAFPGAAFSIILYTIALMMDENYPSHISECDTVYYHSFLDSKIHSIPTKDINKKAFKYFAAFRTQEDAVKAIKLTQAAIKYLSE